MRPRRPQFLSKARANVFQEWVARWRCPFAHLPVFSRLGNIGAIVYCGSDPRRVEHVLRTVSDSIFLPMRDPLQLVGDAFNGEEVAQMPRGLLPDGR
eukprot:7341486-Prymnesium_polylepis.1